MITSQKQYHNKNIFTQWLRGLSLGKKLSIIILLIVLTLLFEFGNFWLGMKITSGIRSYVAGEGLWSKAQKAATNSLLEYSITSQESDYQNFLNLMQVPLDYKAVRLELEKKNPDFEFIKNTWIKVGIHPDDVNDSYFLYRNFKNVVYMQRAIQLWVFGDDTLVTSFVALGREMHDVVSKAYDQNDSIQKTIRAGQINALVKRLNEQDNELTRFEKLFSAVLGDGARAIKNILLLTTAIISLILGGFVVFVAFFIARMIIEIDRGKTEFIAVANHQLNTPLSIMKNAYAMVKDNTLTPKEGMEYWGGGLTRMNQVVEDFWNTMKSEGQTRIDVQKNNIAMIVEQVVLDKQKTIATTKKDIIVSIQPSDFVIPPVLCDAKQINNVIYNLLDNAISYTQQGSIIISYELIDGYVKVNIRDTGIGFLIEDKEKMGQKFYRAKKALLSRPDGSGLGLYICKNLIENNKGKLSYESEGENRGSVFSFTLPIAR